MKLLASYRVCKGVVPGEPVRHHMPDPCYYGHLVKFVAEIVTAATPGEGSPVYNIEIEPPGSVALTLAMMEIFTAFHSLIDEHPDWVEYRWRLYVAPGTKESAVAI